MSPMESQARTGTQHSSFKSGGCPKMMSRKRITTAPATPVKKQKTSTVKTKDAAAKELLKPLRTQQCAVETSDIDQVLSYYSRCMEQLLPPSTVRRHATLRDRFADTIANAKKKMLELDSIEVQMKKVREQQALEAQQQEELEKLEAEEKAAEGPMKTGEVAKRSS